MDAKKVAPASKLLKEREIASDVREAVGTSWATLQRYLKPDGVPREKAS